jgi:glycosyltransferase involved in cell wall biosynthesis
MKKITFILPTRNNLEFLKTAYKNLKKLSDGFHKILILDDGSTDGTSEWLSSLQEPNLRIYTNYHSERLGIVGIFDKGIELVDTQVIMMFHDDMVPSPNMDVNIIKYLKPRTVVSPTRVEPKLLDRGNEKITKDFGNNASQFDENDWILWSNTEESINENITTEGVSTPWCMFKEDYLSIGGYDKLFAPQSKEDSDIFSRFVLNGYKLIQAWDALVYHFVSRNSRINDDSELSIEANKQWLHDNNKNNKNFIRKWNSFIKHDQYMKPIITPKYDIGFKVSNPSLEAIAILEPLCNNIGVENRHLYIDEYVRIEQEHTPFNLAHKIIEYNNVNNNVIVEFDIKRMSKQSFNVLLEIPQIIKESGEIGEFELDVFRVIIKDMTTYENDLIIANK